MLKPKLWLQHGCYLLWLRHFLPSWKEWFLWNSSEGAEKCLISWVWVLLAPCQMDWCLPKKLRTALVPHFNWDLQLQSPPACLEVFSPHSVLYPSVTCTWCPWSRLVFSFFLCCYLRDKQLCVSEHIESSSKKHVLNSISVLIKQAPFEVLWPSCVPVHVFGYLAIPLSYVMHLLL